MSNVCIKATTLREAFACTDPVIPLPSGDPRYVDCTPVRGDEDLVTQMYRTVTWSDADSTQLFTGHRGSGKSTELLRLQARLENAGYVVLFFEADDDLDVNDLQYADLLLTIARHVIGDLSEQGIRLREDLLREVEGWFSETLYTEAKWRDVERELAAEAALGIGLPEQFPLVAKLLARVTGQIKTGKAVRSEIRLQLDPQISQLMANLNLMLKDANAKILKRGGKGLVLIIDSLDRVVYRDLGDGRTTHTALYVEHGEQLCGLDCHVVYTVPISLLYSSRATVVEQIFERIRVLPMIKTHDRDDQPFDEGLSYLRRILDARLDLDTLFAPAAVTFLCEHSGGHPRDLIRMVRQACIYAPENVLRPITLAAVERAFAQLVATYGRMIPEAHYPLLAGVHLAKTIRNDADHELMLYNLSVLEYVNGQPPWHDVHPAVPALPKFLEALAALKPDLGV